MRIRRINSSNPDPSCWAGVSAIRSRLREPPLNFDYPIAARLILRPGPFAKARQSPFKSPVKGCVALKSRYCSFRRSIFVTKNNHRGIEVTQRRSRVNDFWGKAVKGAFLWVHSSSKGGCNHAQDDRDS